LLALGISAQAQVYLNVLKFGVKNDSSKLATEGIKKAIASAVKQGEEPSIFLLENIKQVLSNSKVILPSSSMLVPSYILPMILTPIFRWFLLVGKVRMSLIFHRYFMPTKPKILPLREEV
jgi:hypothetical protein